MGPYRTHRCVHFKAAPAEEKKSFREQGKNRWHFFPPPPPHPTSSHVPCTLQRRVRSSRLHHEMSKRPARSSSLRPPRQEKKMRQLQRTGGSGGGKMKKKVTPANGVSGWHYRPVSLAHRCWGRRHSFTDQSVSTRSTDSDNTAQSSQWTTPAAAAVAAAAADPRPESKRIVRAGRMTRPHKPPST